MHAFSFSVCCDPRQLYCNQAIDTETPPNVDTQITPVPKQRITYDSTEKPKSKSQYSVHEKGEMIEFKINDQGMPELWLQVDHSQVLVSPLTEAHAKPRSGIMSTSKKNIMTKISLLSIHEHKGAVQRGSIDEIDDSDEAEDMFLDRYQHLAKNEIVETNSQKSRPI